MGHNKGDLSCELSHIFETWELWDSNLPSLPEAPGWLHNDPSSLTHKLYKGNPAHHITRVPDTGSDAQEHRH